MSAQLSHEKEWAVVTGASSGLGAIFAEQLAKRGLSLLLAGRDEPRLSKVADRVRETTPNVEVELLVGDLGTDSGVDSLTARLHGRTIAVLVNNAGFGTYGRFSEVDAGREHELVAVNVDALVRLTHAVLPGMLARGRGGILNVASTIAFQPGPYQATYGASKAFVLSLSQALWAETRGTGVTVTALCPPPTRTGWVACKALRSWAGGCSSVDAACNRAEDQRVLAPSLLVSTEKLASVGVSTDATAPTVVSASSNSICSKRISRTSAASPKTSRAAASAISQ